MRKETLDFWTSQETKHSRRISHTVLEVSVIGKHLCTVHGYSVEYLIKTSG